jgi:lysophospholipase L1-like esterase
MRKFTENLILVLLLVLVTTSFQQDKVKILIIGDSISIGYTPFVIENLENIAVVFHNPGNAQHTATGLANIDAWIGDTDWDIIQFNWGLWDVCYRHPDSKQQGNRDKINGLITFNTDDYGKNLDSIVKLIRKKSDAELIFVTTTYIPDDDAGRYKEDAVKYNKIAKRIMAANDVKVNDIYEKSVELHHEFGKGIHDVHYSKEGYRKLGWLISDYLTHKIEQLSNKD